MASAICSVPTTAAVRSHSSPRSAIRGPVCSPHGLGRTAGFTSVRPSAPQKTLRSPRSRTAPSASAVEVFQLADEGALIGGTAAVLFAITLVGLAVGFVLLRVEALVEEGKI